MKTASHQVSQVIHYMSQIESTKHMVVEEFGEEGSCYKENV